jgi:hypothetical protein
MNLAMHRKEHYIGEEIHPVKEEFDYSASAPGEPALPRQFIWRHQTIEIRYILRRWKTASGCRHGSADRYVRKHWYEIRTMDNRVMTIYFDRQFKDPRGQKRRWWLFSMTDDANTPGPRTQPPSA